jgi:cyclopropane fatty-acyl-phospholipid synthase-like methyltransferase
MRDKAEGLYDHLSSEYWAKFGRYPNEAHREYVQKLLERATPGGTLLSAACGAGRYDGMLLEAGHSVVGIDQSEGMLAQARERFPEARYEKMRLQEMAFREEFGGAICMDAMEHVCPEDWPGIMRGFSDALKPGAALCFTMPSADQWVDEVDEAYEQAKAAEPTAVSVELADVAAYHYCPSLDQARTWIRQAGLAIEEQGPGSGYEHFVVSRRP